MRRDERFKSEALICIDIDAESCFYFYLQWLSICLVPDLLNDASPSRRVSFDEHFSETKRAQILGRLPCVCSILANEGGGRLLENGINLLQGLVCSELSV